MALGAIRAIKEYGLDIPADISVIGFDDFQLPIRHRFLYYHSPADREIWQ
jgi:DNA-binding LacI/PurR family transcriptional regulator